MQPVFLNTRENVMENAKKVKFGETGPRYDQKFVWSDNFGQNIWNKVKKPNKFGQH